MTNAARFALGVAGALVALVSDASAHPMGNISVSHYAGIEIESDGVRVKYLLDFAEIPAVRELELVDPDVDNRVTPEEREKYLSAKTQEILPHLRLEVNGKALPLEAIWSRVTFPPGEGGLSTVRVAWELHTAWTDSLNAKNLEMAQVVMKDVESAGANPDMAALNARLRPVLEKVQANQQSALRQAQAILNAEQWRRLPPRIRNGRAGGPPR